MSLVVTGTVAFDAIETPFGKTDKIVGGAATYACLAASYFYKNVKMVGVVGDDFPKEDIQSFQDHGISTEGLQVKADLNVLADFDPILPESYQDCEFLLLGNLSPQVQQTTIQRLKNRPKLIVLDTMNFWMDIALDELLATLKLVDVLTINDAEARQLSGEYSLVKAAEKILQMGPSYLIIKKGEHGALLFHENQIFSAPALPLAEVFDPTGAGDTFAGGFIGYLAKVGTINFNNMKNAIIYGSALASFCVEKFGTERIKNLSEDEISARVKEFVSLTSFTI